MTDHTALVLQADRPRILFLCADAGLMRGQLAGDQLTRARAGALRDDVSTDEITPAAMLSHDDERLARFPYTGLIAGGELPVAAGAVRAGGFSVTVAGRRSGKGSSREHSPAAEKLAGIRLVIAESFERIYRQNADNTVQMHVNTASAKGTPPQVNTLGGMARFAGLVLRLAGARLSGGYKATPFFDAKGAPLAEVVVAERAAVEEARRALGR